MGFLTDWITDWLKSLLIDGIMGNFEGLFTEVNNQVGEIATQVGTSPAAWYRFANYRLQLFAQFKLFVSPKSSRYLSTTADSLRLML